MRLTRYHLFLLGGLLLMVMGPLAFTQPGSGGGGKGGRGGKGGKGMNPDFIFNKMSGGKETFEVAKVQLPDFPNSTAEQQKQQMLTLLQQKGITNGIMTKAVFADYWEQRMTQMRALREGKTKPVGTPPPPPGAPPAAPAAAPAQDIEAQAREEFARMDADKNGSLSVEEILLAKKGRRLYDDRAKWDTNKNGTIELPEYIEYYKSRRAQQDNGGRGNQDPPKIPTEPIEPVEEDKRPTVYRTGKFPKELPPWFEEADKDKDGQVGLYEWKASGKPIREFMAMDLNGDGFLTVEEVLRYQRATVKATTSPTLGTPTAPSTFSVPKSQGDNGNGNGRQRGNRPPKGS